MKSNVPFRYPFCAIQVLADAVEAGSRVGAIFKEPTITPSALQVRSAIVLYFDVLCCILTFCILLVVCVLYYFSFRCIMSTVKL
jgi:hypothetical protein